MLFTRQRGLQAAAIFAATALVATACGGDNNEGGQGAQPVRGGTLKVIGASDVDHLDPASGYYTVTYTLERAWVRQLFNYPSDKDVTKSVQVAPDLASELPTTDNGGISADGKTYTIKLRDGVQWNTSPPRPVTAQDAVLGMKRICNPVSPAGAPGYYLDTIQGMKQFCDGFAKVNGDPKAMTAYIDGHEISGVQAKDDKTIVFTLIKPAGDFLNILAMPFASPAPKEYNSYVPDSAEFRQHTIANGPYAITKYSANKEIVLEKNPAWTQDSDPLRHQYVDRIQVTQGQASDAAVQQQLVAGTADLAWDLTVPTADIPQLQSSKDPNLGIFPSFSTNPYLAINLQSPNQGGALQKKGVRVALNYAIDKTALGKVYGGPSLNTPLNQVIPPESLGYKEFNLYPTPDNKGDPAKCKDELSKAGYPNGLTLKFLARNAGNHPAVAQSVQADLAKCGIKAKIISVTPTDFYGRYLNDVAATKKGVWDIAEPGWIPDWFGNNGRTVIEPLFDGRNYGPNSVDYGAYNNPKVNSLIDEALATTDQAKAADLLNQADRIVMEDAAFVPFQTQKVPLYHSSRVKNATFSPFGQSYDWTNMWLNPPS